MRPGAMNRFAPAEVRCASSSNPCCRPRGRCSRAVRARSELCGLTVAALNAGIRPGERAPTPVAPPSVTPRERVERAGTRVMRTHAAGREPNGWGRPAKQLLRKPHTFRLRMPGGVDPGARPPVAGERLRVRPAALIKATSFLLPKRYRLKIESPAGWNRLQLRANSKPSV